MLKRYFQLSRRIGKWYCSHYCGGFIENVPRMFADDLAAEIEEDKIPVLQFSALEKYGNIKHEEMFEIFNMGIGLMMHSR